MTAAKSKPAYDPARRYEVRLSRVVEDEGFTLRPGPNPIQMSGEWANKHAGAIESAQELPESQPHPEAEPEIHKVAED